MRRIPLLCILALTACGPRPDDVADESHNFHAGLKQTVDATRDAISDASLHLVNELPNHNGMMFETARNITAFSGGEKLRVLVEPVSEEETTVRVKSDLSNASKLTRKTYAAGLFEFIGKRLEKTE